MKSLIIIVLLLPMLALAQTYHLKGNYKVKSSEQGPVSFELAWTENNGKIEGKYKDNFFTKEAEAIGQTTELGRTITVTFPSPIKGIRTLTFLSSVFGEEKAATPIPVTVVTRDLTGTPVTSSTTEVAFSMDSGDRIQAQTEAPCVENFGQLEGFCGIYSGMVTEEQDLHNKCNLLKEDHVKLELGTEGEFQIRLGPSSSIIEAPIHPIGRLPVDPASTSVDVMSRVCRAMEGLNFSADNCKRVNLVGAFLIENNKKLFRGGYFIFDEKTGEACKYNLALIKEKASL